MPKKGDADLAKIQTDIDALKAEAQQVRPGRLPPSSDAALSRGGGSGGRASSRALDRIVEGTLERIGATLRRAVRPRR